MEFTQEIFFTKMIPGQKARHGPIL